MANYEPSLRLKHLNNLLLRVPCGGVDLLYHIKENEVVQREGGQPQCGLCLKIYWVFGCYP